MHRTALEIIIQSISALSNKTWPHLQIWILLVWASKIATAKIKCSFDIFIEFTEIMWQSNRKISRKVYSRRVVYIHYITCSKNFDISKNCVRKMSDTFGKTIYLASWQWYIERKYSHRTQFSVIFISNIFFLFPLYNKLLAISMSRFYS